eukprot:2104598-Pleurochrysis_carterae.AAC.1
MGRETWWRAQAKPQGHAPCGRPSRRQRPGSAHASAAHKRSVSFNGGCAAAWRGCCCGVATAWSRAPLCRHACALPSPIPSARWLSQRLG